MKHIKDLRVKAETDDSNDFLLPKDKKAIEYLATKKEKYLEAIKDIDQKILLIQNSTKTLIPLFAPWHHFLRQKSKWYYLWHLKPFAKFLHWFILLVYISSLSGFLLKIFPSSQPMLAVSYDFPRWEWSNPKPVGNTLNSATTCSLDNSYWVVGDAGTILKSSDGSTWMQHYSGVSSNLRDILCLAPDSIIAIGDSGTIIRYNGITWTQISSPVTVTLYEMVAFDSTNVVAVGENGKIINSSDGGQTWTEKSSGTNYGLLGVAAFDSNYAVAVGRNGQVTITSDKGKTWSAKSSGTTASLLDVAVFDSNRAVATASTGKLMLTTDKGQTWSEKNSGTNWQLEAVVASDATHAAAISLNGRLITASSDAGESWSVKFSSSSIYFKAIAALDATHMVAVGSDSVFGAILISSNAGVGWTQVESDIEGASLNAIASSNPSSVVVVGGSGKITYSSNGGQTWTEKSSGYSIALNKIAILDQTHAVAAGYSSVYGNMLVTSDGGSTWNNRSGGSGNLYAVASFDANNVVALGDGNIAVSHNAGASWVAKVPPVSTTFNAVVALDSTHAIAVGDSGKIITTADAGEQWTAATSGVDVTLSDVIALDSTHAIAVGDSGKIITTADAGEQWTHLLSKTDSFLRSLAAFDANQVVAVGTGGTIVLSTDGGVTWTQKTSGTSASLEDVTTFGTNRAVAVGTGGTIVLSTDGGVTWTQKTSGTSENLVSVAARDSSNLVAVGENGAMITSNDGGNTWSPINLTSNYLFDVKPIDANRFFAIGDSGTVLYFHSPPAATATKLLVKLPGQSFADGVGVYGTPNQLRAGEDVSVTIYAVDANNNLDKTNASWVGFSTTDPADTNPSQIQLTQGGTCVQTNRQPGDPECGIGVATFNFHTPGTWTITASDIYNVLASGTSSSFNVIAGYPSYLYFSNIPNSLSAGSVSGPITLLVKDIYGNNTTVENNTTIRLTTTSSRGRFSQNPNGPWSTGQLDITVPVGSGTFTFYYLDLNTGNPTITASEIPDSGWQDAQSTITITVGQLSQSTLSVDKTSVAAGDTVNATVVLKNQEGLILSNKTVSISSSRSDSISPSTQVTDANGSATFKIKPTLVGSFTLTAYDVSDNLYVPDEQDVQVAPGALAKISLKSNINTSVAGVPFTIYTTLYDAYDNLATNFNEQLLFTSSDKQAEFEEAQHTFSDADKGKYDQQIVLKTAGTQSITASSKDGKVTSTLSLAIAPAAVSPLVSTVSSDKDKIKPKEETAMITVRLLDAYGNGVGNKLVELFSTRKEDNISPERNVTASNGSATFLFSSDAEGESILQAADITDSIILQSRLKITVAQPSLLDIIKQSPVIQKITRAFIPITAALATLGLIPLLLQALPSALHLFTGAFPMLFTVAVMRRKRRKWGMVFDSLTGRPVDFAIVRLFEAESNKLVQTKVTDINGRFNFLVGKGRYYIKVTKPDYIFPSHVPKLKATQLSTRLGPETDIYLGQTFNIENDDTNINLNIPLDPVWHGLPIKWKIVSCLKNAFDWFLISFSYASLPLILIGACIAAFVTLVNISRLNLFIDVFYIFLLATYAFARKVQRARLGFVFDARTKEPIQKAVISIFDREYRALREVKISDSHGHFAILLPKGEYYLTVRASGYKFPSKTLKEGDFYHGGIISNSKPSFLSVNIPMDRG